MVGFFDGRSSLPAGAIFSRAALALSCFAAALSSGVAQAGTVQLHPLAYLQTIFDQPSIMAATGGAGITVNIETPRILLSNITDGYNLAQLDAAIGSNIHDGSIPLFYIDDYGTPPVISGPFVSGVVGLGYIGGPGASLLTVAQEDLQPGPEIDYCSNGDCYTWLIGGVTAADVKLAQFGAAEIVAHEIGHNLGLQHYLYGPNLMDAYATEWNAGGTSLPYYSLTADQVSTILQSPLVHKQNGEYSIDLSPYSVLSSLPATSNVPEPASWAMFIGGFGLIGVGIRRRRVAVSFA